MFLFFSQFGDIITDMSIVDAYRALRDIRYRLMTRNSPLEVVEANRDSVVVCKGNICFEIHKPEKVNKAHVVPITKWERSGKKMKITMERKYIPLLEFNKFMNTASFNEFVARAKQIKEAQEYQDRLKTFFDYLYTMFFAP